MSQISYLEKSLAHQATKYPLKEFDNGTIGATFTVAWNKLGYSQKLTLPDAGVVASCALTFLLPQVVTWITLKIVSPATGTVPAVTWPSLVKWPGATAIPPAATLGSSNIYSFYFDGVYFWGTAIVNAA